LIANRLPRSLKEKAQSSGHNWILSVRRVFLEPAALCNAHASFLRSAAGTTVDQVKYISRTSHGCK
jgi:hypothetical protein